MEITSLSKTATTKHSLASLGNYRGNFYPVFGENQFEYTAEPGNKAIIITT